MQDNENWNWFIVDGAKLAVKILMEPKKVIRKSFTGNHFSVPWHFAFVISKLNMQLRLATSLFKIDEIDINFVDLRLPYFLCCDNSDIAYKDISSYHIISKHIISYQIISYHIISYHTISYHIISYHIISYHIISYQNISYHIISNHIISLHFISVLIVCVTYIR